MVIDSSQVDVKAKLTQHLPSLLQLMGNNPFKWDEVNAIFIEKFTKRYEEYIADNNYLQVEITFYDVITQKLSGNHKYLYLFTYFDNLLIDLNKYLPDKKKSLLSGTFWHLLTNWDLKFLNFIGELSVLNNLLKSGYELEMVEEKMPNGKRMDFKVKSTTGKMILVEVVNIHLPDKGDKTDKQLVKSIRRKLVAKVNMKSKKSLINTVFHLVPVLWGKHQMLLKVKDLYDTHLDLQHLNIYEPVAYSCFIYENQYIIKFGSLKTLLNI